MQTNQIWLFSKVKTCSIYYAYDRLLQFSHTQGGDLEGKKPFNLVLLNTCCAPNACPGVVEML